MKEFRLGVLFVHGIGTQPPRDTLVRWGDVLLKVIGRATEEGPGRITPIVGRADAGDRSLWRQAGRGGRGISLRRARPERKMAPRRGLVEGEELGSNLLRVARSSPCRVT